VSLSAARASSLVDPKRLVERLTGLVRIDSQNPPGREAAAGEVVAGLCEEMGLDVSSHEAASGRPNVVARVSFGDGPVVAYCSHIDTVPIGDRHAWRRDPLGAQIAEGRLWGRGACDAKGPIAAALEAVAVLRDADPRLAGTLELELVSDEETMGFLGAGYLLEEGIVAPRAVIVGEPTSLRLVTAQRGACWMQLTTRGVAAHGSSPERGVNAIVHMAEVLTHLTDALPDVSHPILGGPSINVGTITGGSKVNMVAASCSVEIDRRTIPEETPAAVLSQVGEAIERARRRFPEIDADAAVSFYGRPFEIAEDAPLVADVRAALTEANGRPAEIMGFRGASDARFFAEAGAEVVVCGPGDIGVAHTIEENIELEELERAAVAYALAFARLLEPGAQRLS
jgi:acetylornithine deacetylase/succinyl-diaminopimelate desuccinylase family protein